MDDFNEQKPQELDAMENTEYPVIVDTTIGIHESSTMLHYHDYIELCYFKQGSGVYIIEGKQHTFCAGDIFVIDSNEIHVAYGEDTEILVILFKPDFITEGNRYIYEIEYLKPYWKISKSFENKIDRQDEYYPKLLRTMLEVDTESRQREDGYKLMMKSLLLKFSVLLSRYAQRMQAEDIPDRAIHMAKIKNVLGFIEKNYAKKVKLAELAQFQNMSISGFCNVFKGALGISPMDYLIRYRILKATELLMSSDMKVVDIAESCGFNSMPHFINCFKRFTGKIPKDYRRLCSRQEKV